MIVIPRFSVIVPVYNTVNELSRCVESILAQTFADFELILVDDGSTDGSGELCDHFQRQDKRVRSFHKENGGCSEARNYGVRRSIGEFLIFADSDDMWGDTKALEDIDQIIGDKKNVDVVCFGVEIIDEDEKSEKIRIPALPEHCGTDKSSRVQSLVYTNQYFSTSYVKVLKRDFFIENDLFFIKGLLSEDIEWSGRILVLCSNLEVYSNAFYKRIRRSEGSITSSIGEKNIFDILKSIENGIIFVEGKSENHQMKELYYEYWSYQYAMLLSLLHVIHKDKINYTAALDRMKRLRWLLKYDHVGKVKLVKWAVKLIGLSNAAKILGMYYRLK